ncbi:hypothetical protein HYH03_017045 [Edaphochlamys debaryana]|uniref:F-box domain-containing protein n=1 Tax=Edaphochlamys debaryana TaxID=47281 RepID=A0A836BQV9_9CHLO|nr:hypothetical protein HYH03_017045 [Edaphochlamys debaryana]|eukprot:KAG2484164.1 hypothetical protein HYH03_017045 [Edaphochlamys debaryana]
MSSEPNDNGALASAGPGVVSSSPPTHIGAGPGLLSLPDLVLIHVLSYLPPASIVRFGAVCRRCHGPTTDDTLVWAPICASILPPGCASPAAWGAPSSQRLYTDVLRVYGSLCTDGPWVGEAEPMGSLLVAYPSPPHILGAVVTSTTFNEAVPTAVPIFRVSYDAVRRTTRVECLRALNSFRSAARRLLAGHLPPLAEDHAGAAAARAAAALAEFPPHNGTLQLLWTEQAAAGEEAGPDTESEGESEEAELEAEAEAEGEGEAAAVAAPAAAGPHAGDGMDLDAPAPAFAAAAAAAAAAAGAAAGGAAGTAVGGGDGGGVEGPGAEGVVAEPAVAAAHEPGVAEVGAAGQGAGLGLDPDNPPEEAAAEAADGEAGEEAAGADPGVAPPVFNVNLPALELVAAHAHELAAMAAAAILLADQAQQGQQGGQQGQQGQQGGQQGQQGGQQGQQGQAQEAGPQPAVRSTSAGGDGVAAQRVRSGGSLRGFRFSCRGECRHCEVEAVCRWAPCGPESPLGPHPLPPHLVGPAADLSSSSSAAAAAAAAAAVGDMDLSMLEAPVSYSRTDRVHRIAWTLQALRATGYDLQRPVRYRRLAALRAPPDTKPSSLTPAVAAAADAPAGPEAEAGAAPRPQAAQGAEPGVGPSSQAAGGPAPASGLGAVAPPLPLAESVAHPLEGIWRGTYGSHGIEMLLVRRMGPNLLVGTKLTGDDNVPAGKDSFRVFLDRPGTSAAAQRGKRLQLPPNYATRVHVRQDQAPLVQDSFQAQGQVAGSGYEAPAWIEAEAVLFGPGSFGLLWHGISSFSGFRRVRMLG